MSVPFEDYAAIGDGHTAALIGNDGDDPRMLDTIEAVEKDLMHDGLVRAGTTPHRYMWSSPTETI